MLEGVLDLGITSATAERIFSFQPQCVVCGSSYGLHIHHRVFRSEGESFLRSFLESASWFYSSTYKRSLPVWGLHSIQNLVVLCVSCHEGNGVGVHGGNEKLRKALRNSFTCPITGFNVPFVKICERKMSQVT